MPAIVIGLLGFAGILALLWLFSRANAQTIAQVGRTLLIVAGIASAALLLWIGRYALAGIVPVLVVLALRMLPSLLGRMKARQAGRAYGQQSGVTTAFLSMRLDHQSGQATGEVLAGSFAGRSLGSLSLGEAMALRHEVAGNAQSLSLLDAWLDKRFPNWRQTPPPGASASGKMQRDEALAILELKEGASREEIEGAYRRLMQKLHPDHGGSTWMAAKLNEARELLLGETR